MKKYILAWILTVFVFFVICFIFYFLYVPKPKQSDIKIYEKETLKNLETKILFYENTGNADKILESLYDEKGHIYRHRNKYSEAYNSLQKSLILAQKNNNKSHELELVWFLVYLASVQEKSDLVLSLCDKYKDFRYKKNVNFSMPSFAYYYHEGLAHLRKKQIDSALQNLSQGFKLIDKKRPLFYPGYFSNFCCALSIAYLQKKEFKKSIEYLNKAADVFLSVRSVADIEFNKEGNKLFNNALFSLERANPISLDLSSLYQKVAEINDNKEKFEKYTLKAIEVLKEINESKEKIANLYYKLGALKPYGPNKYFDKCIEILKDVKGKDAAEIVYKVACAGYDEKSKKSLNLLILSLKKLPSSDKNPLWVARACQLIAYCYNERKEWQKSAEYANKCLELIKRNNKVNIRSTLASDCYSFLDDFYNSQGDLKKRIKNAKNAVKFMLDIKTEPISLNMAYEQLAKVYKCAGEYSDAEQSYRKIVKVIHTNPKLRENEAYLEQEINAFCQIGALCLLQKMNKKALLAFNAAKKLLTDKNISGLSELFLSEILGDIINIADGYYELDQDTDAEKFYLKAVAMLVSHPEKYHKLLGFLYYRIGNIAFCRKEWQKAKLNFEKSWDNASKAELDTDSLIVLSSKLSICYRKNKQFAKGLKFALVAYNEQKNKYGDNLQTGIYAAGAGSLYNCLDQDKNALKYLEEARQIFKKYGSDKPSLELKVLQYLKELKEKNKRNLPGTSQN
ncbi:MAG: hypothetical protein PHH77_09230 [Victivallaceae bacterium]|nr:hypothetical protein [Victivallaceae bacterium]